MQFTFILFHVRRADGISAGPVLFLVIDTTRSELTRTDGRPSVLWRCWLGGRKGIRPVKTEWWGVGVVICLERGADLHIAQLMPLPLIVSCFSKIQTGFAFLVPPHLGSPGKRAVKRVCVCVCVCVCDGWRVTVDKQRRHESSPSWKLLSYVVG